LRLELPVDAHIPEEYVESERLRLEAYQKLSAASGPASAPEQLDAVLEELTDRYGPPPAQVENLIAVSRLRRMAQKAGLSEFVNAAGKMRIVGAELPDSIQVRLQRMYPGSRYLAQTRTVMLPLPDLPDDAALIDWAAKLLAAIYPLPAVATPVAPAP